MKRVVLALNPTEPSTWTTHEVEDLCEFLVNEFDSWPATARIYQGAVAVDCDVTPADKEQVERLNTLEGPFFVVVYPAGPFAVIAAIVAVVAVAAIAFLIQIPSVSQRNTQAASANNALAARTNEARLLARIEDIYGTVTSTPSLLAPPYTIYENNKAVEIAFMCVGRGTYDVSNVRDGTTPVADINGASVEVYAPNSSPNSGLPQLTIGGSIDEPFVTVSRSNSVNGQVLTAPNFKSVNGDTNIDFSYARSIISTVHDFTDYFSPGDVIEITGASATKSGHAINLNGTYTIDNVSTFSSFGVRNSQITLVAPSLVNSGWNTLNLVTGKFIRPVDPTIRVSGSLWVGPFTLTTDTLNKVYANIVADRGMYKNDGKNQIKTSVSVQLELTPVNESGIAIGSAELFTGTINGSSADQDQRAITLTASPTFTGRCKARLRRTTDADLKFKGTVVDEVKWQDLYAVSPITQSHFGNVTTVYSRTLATEGATALKERRLNMLVTRKIKTRVSGSTFTSDLHATNRADHIFSAICTDQYIGNRSSSEIDYDSVYNAISELTTYFGTSKAVEFSYTFDKSNLSFEETAAMIAQAVFCTAYRRGNIIKLNPEMRTDDSTLIFNHRNKLPGSETRTVTFGNLNGYDGVSYQYVSPRDDALITLYIPEDQSAITPQKIESVGIRTYEQAYFHAHRAWNKIKYQNIATQFEATQEADIAVVMDRVLVADNTRSDTQDGDVISQNVLELTLSQPVTFADFVDYTIFLQHTNGTTEGISISAGSTPYKVILAGAPSHTLSTDIENYARATYVIVGDTDARSAAFLVSEKDPQGTFTTIVKAVNYDSRYYANDLDYSSGEIGEGETGESSGGGGGGGGGTGEGGGTSRSGELSVTMPDFILDATGDPASDLARTGGTNVTLPTFTLVSLVSVVNGAGSDGETLVEDSTPGSYTWTPTVSGEVDLYLWGGGGSAGDDEDVDLGGKFGSVHVDASGGGAGGMVHDHFIITAGVPISYVIGGAGDASTVASRGLTAGGGGDSYIISEFGSAYSSPGGGGTASGGIDQYDGESGGTPEYRNGGSAAGTDGVYGVETAGHGADAPGASGAPGKILIIYRTVSVDGSRSALLSVTMPDLTLTSDADFTAADGTGLMSATLPTFTLTGSADVTIGGTTAAVDVTLPTFTLTGSASGDLEGTVLFDRSTAGSGTWTPSVSGEVDLYVWGGGGNAADDLFIAGHEGSEGDPKDPGDDVPPTEDHSVLAAGAGAGGLVKDHFTVVAGVGVSYVVGGPGANSTVSSRSITAYAGGSSGFIGESAYAGSGGSGVGGSAQYAGHDGARTNYWDGGGARDETDAYTDQTSASSTGTIPAGGGSAPGGAGRPGRILAVYRTAGDTSRTGSLDKTLPTFTLTGSADVTAPEGIAGSLDKIMPDFTLTGSADVSAPSGPSYNNGDVLYDSYLLGHTGSHSYTPDANGFADIYVWGGGGNAADDLFIPGYPGDGGEDPKDPGDDTPPTEDQNIAAYGAGGGGCIKHHFTMTSGSGISFNIGGAAANSTCSTFSMTGYAGGDSSFSGVTPVAGVGGTGSGTGGDTAYDGHDGALTNYWDGGGGREITGTRTDQTTAGSTGTSPAGGGSAPSGAGRAGRVLIIYRTS